MIPIFLITYDIILLTCRLLMIQNKMSITVDLSISDLEIFLPFHCVYKYTSKKWFRKATKVKVVLSPRKVSKF